MLSLIPFITMLVVTASMQQQAYKKYVFHQSDVYFNVDNTSYSSLKQFYSYKPNDKLLFRLRAPYLDKFLDEQRNTGSKSQILLARAIANKHYFIYLSKKVKQNPSLKNKYKDMILRHNLLIKKLNIKEKNLQDLSNMLMLCSVFQEAPKDLKAIYNSPKAIETFINYAKYDYNETAYALMFCKLFLMPTEEKGKNLRLILSSLNLIPKEKITMSESLQTFDEKFIKKFTDPRLSAACYLAIAMSYDYNMWKNERLHNIITTPKNCLFDFSQYNKMSYFLEKAKKSDTTSEFLPVIERIEGMIQIYRTNFAFNIFKKSYDIDRQFAFNRISDAIFQYEGLELELYFLKNGKVIKVQNLNKNNIILFISQRNLKSM